MVRKEFWEIEELGDEFLYVRHVGMSSWQPRIFHWVKQAVRKVEMTTLQGEDKRAVRTDIKNKC